MPPGTRLIGETALTLGCGAAGALLFWQIGLPAAFLTGPAAFVTLAALAGAPVAVPGSVQTFCFVLIGVGIGSGVSAETLKTAINWPISFALLAVVQWLSIVTGAWLLARCFGYDRQEAIICAVPGLLSFVVSLALDRGADVARVSLVQSIRVLFLALLVPVLLKLSGFEISAAVGDTPVNAAHILIPLLLVAWGLGSLLVKAGLPAAHVLTGVILAAVASLTGISSGGVPQWLSLVAFVTIGSLIGSRFRGRTLREMRTDAVAGVAMTTSAAAIALLGALIVSSVLSIPLAPLMIAFAPGGLEVMIALSVQLGSDPTFVAAHHVVRLMILLCLVPVLLRRAAER